MIQFCHFLIQVFGLGAKFLVFTSPLKSIISRFSHVAHLGAVGGRITKSKGGGKKVEKWRMNLEASTKMNE